jgi:hypothetical protein
METQNWEIIIKLLYGPPAWIIGLLIFILVAKKFKNMVTDFIKEQKTNQTIIQFGEVAVIVVMSVSLLEFIFSNHVGKNPPIDFEKMVIFFIGSIFGSMIILIISVKLLK